MGGHPAGVRELLDVWKTHTSGGRSVVWYYWDFMTLGKGKVSSPQEKIGDSWFKGIS